MKPAAMALFFLVTWQEYILKSTEWKEEAVFTVETVDKSIKLKTKADVGKFLNEQPDVVYINGYVSERALIGPRAFKINVREIKQ